MSRCSLSYLTFLRKNSSSPQRILFHGKKEKVRKHSAISLNLFCNFPHKSIVFAYHFPTCYQTEPKNLIPEQVSIEAGIISLQSYPHWDKFRQESFFRRSTPILSHILPIFRVFRSLYTYNFKTIL